MGCTEVGPGECRAYLDAGLGEADRLGWAPVDRADDDRNAGTQVSQGRRGVDDRATCRDDVLDEDDGAPCWVTALSLGAPLTD